MTLNASLCIVYNYMWLYCKIVFITRSDWLTVTWPILTNNWASLPFLLWRCTLQDDTVYVWCMKWVECNFCIVTNPVPYSTCALAHPPPPPPPLYTLSIKDVGQDPENDASAQCHVWVWCMTIATRHAFLSFTVSCQLGTHPGLCWLRQFTATHMHPQTHTRRHTCTYVSRHSCMHACTHTHSHMHTCTHAHNNIHMHARMHTAAAAGAAHPILLLLQGHCSGAPFIYVTIHGKKGFG